MRINILLSVLLLSTLPFLPVRAQTMRCQTEYSSAPTFTSSKTELILREKMQFQMVFHVLYSAPEENISLGQIISQVQVLNSIMNQQVIWSDPQILQIFRDLKDSPDFQFCLADTDPQGHPTNGVTRTFINDLSIACKREFGKRSIMHRALGGIDVWDPARYINVYIINRKQCPALGEAIFPWDARADEDGLIIHYEALGYAGVAADNYPFHQGKTLVHELGHYFGLYHLSRDRSDCTGDDEVDDTPVQSDEYFGCPRYAAETCGSADMYMNYMSLVDDPCMLLFTKGQVNRMKQIIQMFRPQLPGVVMCLPGFQDGLTDIQWTFENGHWMLFHGQSKSWSAEIELYDATGKFIWKASVGPVSRYVIPDIRQEMNSGIYFVILRGQNEQRVLKLFTN